MGFKLSSLSSKKNTKKQKQVEYSPRTAQVKKDKYKKKNRLIRYFIRRNCIMLDEQVKLFIHHYHRYQKKNQNVLWDLMVDTYMNRFIWIGESMKTMANTKMKDLDFHHTSPIIIISIMMVLLQYFHDDLWTIAVYIVFNISF